MNSSDNIIVHHFSGTATIFTKLYLVLTYLFAGPATYGVAKRLRDNDESLHTDKQMYSCGSLAPKMGWGKREGGCMDHKFRKEPEPWELSDG